MSSVVDSALFNVDTVFVQRISCREVFRAVLGLSSGTLTGLCAWNCERNMSVNCSNLEKESWVQGVAAMLVKFSKQFQLYAKCNQSREQVLTNATGRVAASFGCHDLVNQAKVKHTALGSFYQRPCIPLGWIHDFYLEVCIKIQWL